MSQTNDIEVVMAVFNGLNFLEEQILSIYNQSLKPTRLIIRDDCSTDGSQQAIEKLSKSFPEWLHLIPSKTRLGSAANFGFLLQEARAPYVALADQDDIWHPEKLQICFEQCQNLESRNGKNIPILIHSDLTVVSKNGSSISPSFLSIQRLEPDRISIDQLLLQNVVTGCTIFVNRSLLNHANPIPKNFVLHDLWLALVASRFGIITFIPKALVCYRQHGFNEIGVSGTGFSYFFDRILELSRKPSWTRLSNYYLHARLFHDRFGGELPKIVEYQNSGILVRLKMLIFGEIRKYGFLRQLLFLTIMIFKLRVGIK